MQRNLGRRAMFEPLEDRSLMAEVQFGNWRIVGQANDPANGPAVTATLPAGTPVSGGANLQGNVFAVHYAYTTAPALHAPLIVAMQANGFVRQEADTAGLYTSFRHFAYYSSGNGVTDKSMDESILQTISVVGLEGEALKIVAVYRNHDVVSGDDFQITVDYRLQPPTAFLATTEMDITITNQSGRAVVPFWDGHIRAQEQWRLLGISTMYVADNFDAQIPSWLPDIAGSNQYINFPGLGDGNLLNDGRSVKLANAGENPAVSTHDTKSVSFDSAQFNLEHGLPYLDRGDGTNAKLVLAGQHARQATARHLYDPMRTQRAEIVSASGLVNDPLLFNWSLVYNQTDTSLTDGDNVQLRAGFDEQILVWPAGGVQRLTVRLESGASIGKPAWQNPLNNLDVNRIGQITAFDALGVINALNAHVAATQLPPVITLGQRPNGYYNYIDVTGDGRVTAFDALAVINELNRLVSGGEDTETAADATENLDYLFALLGEDREDDE